MVRDGTLGTHAEQRTRAGTSVKTVKKAHQRGGVDHVPSVADNDDFLPIEKRSRRCGYGEVAFGTFASEPNTESAHVAQRIELMHTWG